jgi:hypothetical protein
MLGVASGTHLEDNILYTRRLSGGPMDSCNVLLCWESRGVEFKVTNLSKEHIL